MPNREDKKEEDTLVSRTVNLTNKEIISNNNSFHMSSDTTRTSSESELEYWPTWVHKVTCISHLSIAVNSSVNFFIYYIKRKALNRGKCIFYANVLVEF